MGLPFRCKESPQRGVFRSFVARCLNYVHHLCIQPLDSIIAFTVRCYLRPRSTSKLNLVFAMPIFFFAIVTFPIALIGVFLRIAIYPFRSNIVCRDRSIAFESSISDLQAQRSANSAADEVRIVSVNVAMSEFETMNAAFQVPASKKRVNDIVISVLRHDPDVICLQEVFHSLCADAIASLLCDHGYFVAFQSDTAAPFSLSSGLLMASKVPFRNCTFEKFDRYVGLESLAAKGFLAFECNFDHNIPGLSSTLQLITTHLQSGSSTLDMCTTRFHQLSQIHRFIQEQKCADSLSAHSSLMKSSTKSTIIAGDFNMFYDTDISECSENERVKNLDFNEFFVESQDIRCLKTNDHARNLHVYTTKRNWNHLDCPVDATTLASPMYSRGSTIDMAARTVRNSLSFVSRALSEKTPTKQGLSLKADFDEQYTQLLKCPNVLSDIDSYLDRMIPRNANRSLDHIFLVDVPPNLSCHGRLLIPWGPHCGICSDHYVMIGTLSG